MKEFIEEMNGLRNRGKQFLYASIAKNNQILMKQWFESHTNEEPLPVYSVTKTVSALLIGILITQKKLDSVDDSVLQWFPEHRDKAIVEEVKLKHLLTMTAGFRWPEIESFGHPEGVFKQFARALDPVGFVFEQPIEQKPGEIFAYNSGISHLLMHIGSRICGEPVDVFLQKYLWTPLGVSENQVDWVRDPQGVPYGGHGLKLSAFGMEQLASLMLGKGLYEGKQIIDHDYMKTLSTPLVKNTRGYQGYGYQTWIGSVEGESFHAAFGHGGQRIYVFDKLDMKVVFLGRNIVPEFGLQERLIKGALRAIQNPKGDSSPL